MHCLTQGLFVWPRNENYFKTTEKECLFRRSYNRTKDRMNHAVINIKNHKVFFFSSMTRNLCRTLIQKAIDKNVSHETLCGQRVCGLLGCNCVEKLQCRGVSSQRPPLVRTFTPYFNILRREKWTQVESFSDHRFPSETRREDLWPSLSGKDFSPFFPHSESQVTSHSPVSTIYIPLSNDYKRHQTS